MITGILKEIKVAENRVSMTPAGVEAMVTHRLPLQQTFEGFRLLQEAQEALKVIIEPWRGRSRTEPA